MPDFARQSFRGLAAMAVVGAVLGAASPGAAADGSHDPVMQVLADTILIDRQCHALQVNFGILFDYARQQNVAPTSIMPLGRFNDALKAAMQLRTQASTPEILCGPVAEDAEHAIPGVLSHL